MTFWEITGNGAWSRKPGYVIWRGIMFYDKMLICVSGWFMYQNVISRFGLAIKDFLHISVVTCPCYFQ